MTMTSLVSSLCTSVHRMEKVKFGHTLEHVCLPYDHSIPAPLLILILKLNKEGPAKKDIFRAPGHQANMKKLIHVLQTGRLVNIDNFNIYTIASVLKKFLSKIPDGIFGEEIEAKLFTIHQTYLMNDQLDDRRIREINRLITSLPIVNQQLLVLLIGTFKTISSVAERERTGMTSEALGISVAPSFFHSCITDGCKTAKMEDLHRYKVAISIMRYLIDNFGISELFGHENYAYYARMTSRVLKVNDNWIAYRYPHDLLCEVSDHPSISSLMSHNHPLHHHHHVMLGSDESTAIRVMSSSSSAGQKSLGGESDDTLCKLDQDLRDVNHHAEKTKSLSFLPEVHERQTQRMRERSEWFMQHMQPHDHHHVRRGSDR